ncbi:hypothetical protein Plhal304r1_c013g0050771 [Plasmopara halstedii]
MDPTQLPVTATPPPNVDSRPTMADLPQSSSLVTSKRSTTSTPLVVTGRSSQIAWSRRDRMSSRAPNKT